MYIYTYLTFVFVNMCCSADLTFPTTGLGSLNPWTDTSPITAQGRSWHCLPDHCTRPMTKLACPLHKANDNIGMYTPLHALMAP